MSTKHCYLQLCYLCVSFWQLYVNYNVFRQYISWNVVTSNRPNCLNPVTVLIGLLDGGHHACAGECVRSYYGNKGDVLSQERHSSLQLQGLFPQAASLELTAGCRCRYSRRIPRPPLMTSYMHLFRPPSVKQRDPKVAQASRQRRIR